MKAHDALPEVTLEDRGPRSRRFLRHGVDSLRSVGAMLNALPYGRNRNRADFDRVLTEGRGTCSTKHALLVAVAEELSVPLNLIVGFYAMSEANTPGVGAALAEHGFSFVPEAHCYVRFGDTRIDITRSGGPVATEALVIDEEHRILPGDIGSRKVQLHRAYLRAWLERPDAPRRTLEDVWRAREACISALTERFEEPAEG